MRETGLYKLQKCSSDCFFWSILFHISGYCTAETGDRVFAALRKALSSIFASESAMTDERNRMFLQSTRDRTDSAVIHVSRFEWKAGTDAPIPRLYCTDTV